MKQNIVSHQRLVAIFFCLLFDKINTQALSQDIVILYRGGVMLYRGGVMLYRGGVMLYRGGVMLYRGGVMLYRGGIMSSFPSPACDHSKLSCMGAKSLIWRYLLYLRRPAVQSLIKCPTGLRPRPGN